MRIAFLLGAGVSLPAKLSTTFELTAEIFETANYSRHSDTSFRQRETPGLVEFHDWTTDRPDVRKFLEVLRDEFKPYFGSRTVTYEDLYYAAS